MSQRRTLILVAAIAIGGLASFLVWNYVNGVQDQAYSGAERVPVYLIKETVPEGTTGTEAQASIVKENIPRKFKPSNAVTDLGDIVGKVALSDLVPNQVVVTDMFVDASDPRAQQSFAKHLTKIGGQDMTAITIQTDQIHGVAGLIEPDDYVNILVMPATSTSGGSSSSSSSSSSSKGSVFAELLYQKVRVLAVGQTAVAEPGAAAAGTATTAPAATSSSGVLTLIVPVKAAMYLASIDSSQMYLTLVAPDYKPTAQTAISASDTLPGMDPSQLTPYGPKGADSSSN